MLRVVRDMFRKRTKALLADSGEYLCEAAGYRISYDADRLAVYFGQNVDPIFVLSGINFEEPQTSDTVRGGVPAKVYKFGDDLSITYISSAETVSFAEQFSVQKAVYSRIPNSRQGLELDVMFGMEKARYLIDFALGCTVSNLNELDVRDSLLNAVPPINQMVAFLKATSHQRRTILHSLSGFVRHCDIEQVNRVVGFILKNVNKNEYFMHHSVLSLRDRLQQHGKRVNFNSLAAMCLLTDIYLGKLDEAGLQAYTDNKQSVGISDAACAATGLFLGDSTFEVGDNTDIERGLQFLRDVVGSRSRRTILYDIAEDGGSKISISAVKKLMDTVPEAEINAARDREPLALLLEANGKRIKDDTVAALCLYTDLEIGAISEQNIEQFLPEVYLEEHSAYSLVTVGRNFGLDLRCVRIVSDTPDEAFDTLDVLLKLAKNGVLARFINIENNRYRTFYLKDIEDCRTVYKNSYLFTGQLILELPAAEHVNSAELEEFFKTGKPFMGCFVSEDRVIRWDIVRSGAGAELPASAVDKYGFIEGCRSYRFDGRVLSTASKCDLDDLSSGGGVITVCKDKKGYVKYRYLPLGEEEVRAIPDKELTYDGSILVLPEIKDLQARIYELDAQELAGLGSTETPEYLRLIGCMNGVRAALLSEAETVPLKNNIEILDKIRDTVLKPDFKNGLVEVLDFTSRCKLTAALGPKGKALRGEINISRTVLEALQNDSLREAAVMMILYAMCQDKNGHLEYFKISWSEELFRNLILEKLFNLIHSESISVKILACRLLGARMFAEAVDAYEAAVYVISSMLNDKQVGLVVAMVLARLILNASLEIGDYISLGPWERIDIVKEADTAATEDMTSAIEQWLAHPPVSAEDRSVVVSAMANLRNEKNKIRTLCMYSNKLNDSFLREKDNERVSRRYIILNRGEDESCRKRLLTAWKDFFNSRNMAMMRTDYGAHVFDIFADFIPDYEKKINNRVFLKPQIYEKYSWYKIMVSADPMFAKLASFITSEENDEITSRNVPIICRVYDKSFVRDSIDLGRCEVFCPEANGWLPFMDKRFAISLHLYGEDKMFYENLERMYNTVSNFAANYPQESGSSARAAGGVKSKDYYVSCQNLRELAEKLAEGFRIPNLRRQVLDVLLGACAESRYELLPYVD